MAAIIANPEEDTPRLAFADWLDEYGDEHDRARAEFFRLQVEAARLPKHDKKREKLESRAGKLAAEHHKAWLAPLIACVHQLEHHPKLVGLNSPAWLFVRGLLREFNVQAANFIQKRHQNAFSDAFAAVGLETLSFYTPARRVGELHGAPAFRWVSRMDCPAVGDVALEAFGTSPHFAHISGLEFPEVKISDAGLKTFARTADTSRLRTFTITTASPRKYTKAKFTAAGVLALLNSARLPELTALEIGPLAAEAFGMAAFLADTGLAKLTQLTLKMRVSLADVIACPHLANLRKLRLDDTDPAEGDADALLASPTLAQLTNLTLWTRGQFPHGFEKKLRERFGDNLWLRSGV